jgi:nickel/cobalt transporter (NicO) family protein
VRRRPPKKCVRGPRWPVRLLVLFVWLLACPTTAVAHPLDEVLQATYITVGQTRIELELDLTPGVLVAPQLLRDLDPNGDQTITDAEARAYVDGLVRQVMLRVDGQPLVTTVTRIDMPTHLNIEAGYGTIRVFATAPVANAGEGQHSLAFENAYAPVKSAYQVNAFIERDAPITFGKQNRDPIQQRMTMDYGIGTASAAGAPAEPAIVTSTGLTGHAQQLLAYLDAPTISLWTLLPALTLAVFFGALHALTPGHGKTLVAAYLVGSRGTLRHAVALGAIVTFTHTASVIVIGMLALFASQFVAPNALGPILEILSGVLVVSLGTRLVWQRWVAFQRRGSDHIHAHGHDHDGHSQNHGHSHDHGDGHVHSHLPPAEGFKLGNLVAMGVVGGLVPCPEALGIMIIAIGVNRILLGLGLIVAFSFGLAAVLMVIGILLVRSRSLVERFGGMGNRWSSGLQLGSAVIVTVLGVVMTLNGLASYLG